MLKFLGRQQPLTRCLRLLTLATVLAATTAQAAPRDYNLPAAPLASTLTRIATEAGLTLTISPELIGARQSQPVTGSYEPEDALRLALKGSGLELRRGEAGIWTLQAVPPPSATVLSTVAVLGEQADPDVTEASPSYTTSVLTVGGKTARELRQIQQSVSVVTAQRIHDQVLTTAEEAIGQATGVTMTQGSGYTSNASFSSRGFAMGVQTDGGAPSVNNLWYNTGLPDIAVLDHIEVLRGSDGLFAGAGAPGGTVNLVRKKPLDHQQVRVDALAGSWDRYRTQVDVTGPLGFGGRLRGRAVVAEEKRHYFYDTVDSEKSVLYGVADLDVTSSTLLTAGMSYEQLDRNGLFMGLPRYTNGADLRLSRSSCLCTEWSGREDETRELFVKLRQQLGGGWQLRLNLAQQWLDYAYKQGNAINGVDPNTGAGPTLAGSRTDVANDSKLADVTVDGAFEIFGLAQEVVVGANWQDMYSDGSGVSFYNASTNPAPAVNVFDFNPRAFPEPATPASYVPYKPFGGQKQYGYYATLRSEWLTGLHSIVGLRSSSFENLYTAGNLNSKETDVITPYAGFSYDATAHLTLYGSYAQIFAPQAYSFTEAGELVEPIEGDTYELGAKGSWYDGALNAALSVYRAERRNVAVFLSAYPSTTDRPYYANNCCYQAQAETESRGVDAELMGRLLPGWELSAGYTWNINKFGSGNGANTGSSYSPRTPRHLLKLWTTAQLPGDWSRWKLGGGVNWQSRNFTTGTVRTFDANTGQYTGAAVPYSFNQKAYAVAGLRGELRLNTNWSAALNVNNLLDKTYYQTVGTSASNNFYGEPRSAVLSISGRW